MEFKKLGIEDIEIVRKFFKYSINNISDNTVGGSVMWADFFNTYYLILEETLIFKVNFFERGECFTLPVGKNVDKGLDYIKNFCEEKNIPTQFVTITDDTLKILEKRFKIIEKVKCSDWSDYIYNASDMISFSGRKYHGQKNHINFFKKNYLDYVYEEITDNNIKEVRSFLDEFSKSESKDFVAYEEELKKVYEVLDNNDKYKFCGIMLKVSEKIVAFAMGEKINDTLYVHIEKADKNYRGSYPMIVNEFAKRYAEDVKYINREENAGDKGLESSKLQYHPSHILDKYYVKVVSDML